MVSPALVPAKVLGSTASHERRDAFITDDFPKRGRDISIAVVSMSSDRPGMLCLRPVFVFSRSREVESVNSNSTTYGPSTNSMAVRPPCGTSAFSAHLAFVASYLRHHFSAVRSVSGEPPPPPPPPPRWRGRSDSPAQYRVAHGGAICASPNELRDLALVEFYGPTKRQHLLAENRCQSMRMCCSKPSATYPDHSPAMPRVCTNCRSIACFVPAGAYSTTAIRYY